jgi:very-short-patch-repair endonuclease/predicted transcriptional regulator of viral defense system
VVLDFRAVVDAVVALAARQFGVVARRQLLALGMTSGAITAWLDQGRLHRLRRGVYLLGHPVPAPLALEQGALLAAGGDDAVLTHFTAARLDGFIDEEDDAPIHVTTPRHRGRPKGIVVHTSRSLPPRDIKWRDGLPMTTPARTLIDLAEIADARTLERALETAFAMKRVTERQLRAIIKRLRGRKGGKRLAALLDYRGSSGFTRSHAEGRLRALLKGTDLPEATYNAIVEGTEVDVYFAEPRVAVEVDSWRHHSGQAAFTRDRRKWAYLEARGHKVIGVTAWELDHEPHVAIARIATAVALASTK